ncbi:hypothetical protein [Algiphilus sp.]|uniref:hypothetical protein n=1 Tax=Algiphilus sp. TaxID=1872431 RepID=UPI0025B9BF8D|nr:hypothetical protein [Algiphilus sp.]MCK5769300.1 hypothetical protein [Algiphilus sp.]
MHPFPRCGSAMLAMFVALSLVACSDGDSAGDDSGGASAPATATIPVTREGCNAFGNPPRELLALNDSLFNPTCLPNGERMARHTDAEGTVRDACLYEPDHASTDNPLPLVVWIHPSAVGTDISLAASNVRAGLETADLSGDPDRPGFIMVAPYGRVTSRYYPFPDNNFVPGWDNWYRQLAPDGGARTVNGESMPQNVDAATIDHYLDAVLASGKVDTDRIYLMGWSNGSAMGLLYALNRPEIAAAAIYSSPSPFEAFNDPCTQTPVRRPPADDTEVQVFNPDLPVLHVHNDCDIGGICPNGVLLEQTLDTQGIGGFDSILLNTAVNETEGCLDICGTDPTAAYEGTVDLAATLGNLPGYSLGVANHLRWPVGYTGTMFDFLRDHPN